MALDHRRSLLDEPVSAFPELLRQHRVAAQLTQEALAERAGLSVRAIQNLERGDRHPYPDTTARLAAALALDAGRAVPSPRSLERPRVVAAGARAQPARRRRRLVGS